MNRIQRNAKEFAKLLDIEYIFYLGYKGNCQKIVLRFEKRNFHHLEGIGQLRDIMLHSEPADKVFDMALEGKIDECILKNSTEYEKCYVEQKIKGSSIQAKIFLYKDMSGKDIYLFLDSTNDDEYYYPRSFVVAPELDYKVGQFKYTVLWKEKRNRTTGESEVLSRFKEFDPEKLSA